MSEALQEAVEMAQTEIDAASAAASAEAAAEAAEAAIAASNMQAAIAEADAAAEIAEHVETVENLQEQTSWLSKKLETLETGMAMLAENQAALLASQQSILARLETMETIAAEAIAETTETAEADRSLQPDKSDGKQEGEMPQSEVNQSQEQEKEAVVETSKGRHRPRY